MENASKALIMAASILLGIMLLSILVYAFNQFSGFGLSYNKRLEEQQIEIFNNKFLQYKDKRLTAQDVVTIANLAKDNNTAYDVTYNNDMYSNDILKTKIYNYNVTIAIHLSSNITLLGRKYQATTYDGRTKGGFAHFELQSDNLYYAFLEAINNINSKIPEEENQVYYEINNDYIPISEYTHRITGLIIKEHNR